MNVGERIRELRERRSYGQRELAQLVGLTPNSMWAIEAGRQRPRPATLRKIAQLLKVPVEQLTQDNAHPEQKPEEYSTVKIVENSHPTPEERSTVKIVKGPQPS